MGFVRKPTKESQAVPKGPDALDPSFARKYPALWEYLTLTSWPEGGARETATLLVLVEDGAWKGCLNDRAGNRSAWATAGGLEAVLERLEAGLATDTTEWRRRTSPPPTKKR